MDAHAEYLEKVTGVTPDPMFEVPQDLLDDIEAQDTEALLSTEEKLDELLEILRPLRPVLAALPELLEQVGPLLDGLKTSPVIKMLGIRL